MAVLIDKGYVEAKDKPSLDQALEALSRGADPAVSKLMEHSLRLNWALETK